MLQVEQEILREELGYKIEPDNFFDTITIDVGNAQTVILKSGINEGINFRKIDENKIGITLDERTRPEIIEAVWKAFGLVILCLLNLMMEVMPIT